MSETQKSGEKRRLKRIQTTRWENKAENKTIETIRMITVDVYKRQILDIVFFSLVLLKKSVS